MEKQVTPGITAKKFVGYLIHKYPENKDFLQMFKAGQNAINTLIRNILKETLQNFDDLKVQVLQDPTYSDIDFYLEGETPFNRVKTLLFLLKNILDEVQSGKDEYFENRKILEQAFDAYKYSFSTKKSDGDIVNEMLQNNQLINLSKFGVLFDTGATMQQQSVALAARTGVGKTVFSVNLIKDLVESNNDICVLYFGTPEVNKANFHKRLMMMTSNESINDIMKNISTNENKERNLEKIITLFEMDKYQSITFLINNLQLKKYYMLSDENVALEEKIKEIQEKIKMLITDENKSVLDESTKFLKKRFKSEISSLELKLKENAKTLFNYLKADESLLKIAKDVFDKLLLKPDFLKTGLAITSDDLDLVYTSLLPKENKKELKHSSEYLMQHYPIEKVLNALINIEDFLKFLLNKENKLYDDELKEEIKAQFVEHLHYVQDTIIREKKIIKEESDKVTDFLAKEHVEIEDSLQISKIEQKLKQTRERFPHHKLVFILDYQQKVEGLLGDRSERAETLGKLVNDYAVKYNALGIAMSQLNDIKASEGALKYNTRPKELKVRDGEGMIQGVGTAGMIFNRNMFSYPENSDLPIEAVDLNFVIYEMYLTKNRYGIEGYHATRQYLIFDKKKMTYLPVARKWYSILDKEKELIYLDQLLHYIKNTKSDTISLSEIIE